MKDWERRCITGLGAVLMVCLAVASSDAGSRRLPSAVAKVIAREFPNARVTSVEREREHGVMFYEVNLKENGKRTEVEVSEDGVIGEIESVVSLDDVPKDVASEILAQANGAKIRWVERHERRGRVRSGKLLRVGKPTVTYEAKIISRGKQGSIKVRASDEAANVTLPAKAKAALEAAFPKATVRKVEMEREQDLLLYEVKLVADGRLLEVTVTADGVIVEVAHRAAWDSLPPAVVKTIVKEAKGCTVEETELVERRAVIKGGKVVRLTPPVRLYEVEISRKDHEREIEVAPNGAVLSRGEWERDDEDDEDDDDDDDDD